MPNPNEKWCEDCRKWVVPTVVKEDSGEEEATEMEFCPDCKSPFLLKEGLKEDGQDN
jgi:hypothetical protein